MFGVVNKTWCTGEMFFKFCTEAHTDRNLALCVFSKL